MSSGSKFKQRDLIQKRSWRGAKREDLKFKQSQTVKVVILQTLEKSHFQEKWGPDQSGKVDAESQLTETLHQKSISNQQSIGYQ